MSAPARKRLPRAERQEQTLAVARRLFAERGYAAVTMDDIAAAVGVTKPLLYTYFGNKERLYLACVEPASDALERAVVGAVADAPDGAEAVAAGVRAFFAFVDADRERWRVLFDETAPADGEIAARTVETRERLVRMITGARLAAVPLDHPKRAAVALEAEATATAVLGAAEALARWWLRTEAMSARDAADLLVGGLRVPS